MMWLPVALFLLLTVVGMVVYSAYDDWQQVEEMHHHE